MDRAHLWFALVVGLMLVGACGGSSAEVSSAPVETTASPITDVNAGSEGGRSVGSPTEAPITTEPISTSAATEATTTAPETTIAEVPGDLVVLVGGGQLDLNSIEGQDTVLWFWAPW